MSVAKGFRLSDDSTAKLDWNYVTKPDGTKSIIEEVNDVKQDLAELEGGGLSDDAKMALLACFRHIAFLDDDDDYYQDLYDALYPPAPPKTLVSISAVYTQSGTVYETDSLDSLKTDLVVTALYDDQTTASITTYTLSGTLIEGTSTITVSYGGKTATFNVMVTEAPATPLYDWDFTQSLVDSMSGMTATLRAGATRDESGVHFDKTAQCICLTSEKVTIADRTVIIDISSSDLSTEGTTNHFRLFGSSANNNGNTASSSAVFVYQNASKGGWNVYNGSSWGTPFNKTSYPVNFFNGKRVKIYVGTDLKVKVSYADIGSDVFTEIGTFALAWAEAYRTGYLVIGSYNSNTLNPITFSSIKIYEGEV